MSSGKPNWQLLKEAGEALTAEGRTPFTRGQLIERVRKLHPDVKEGTLNPMIQGMTINLEGGAPGAIGKNVFRSVGRGIFELCNMPQTKRDTQKPPQPVVNEERSRESDEGPAEQEAGILAPQSESEIRDLLMRVLFLRLGKAESWKGSGKSAQFELRAGEFRCYAERSMSYELPGGESLNHCSDILISGIDGRRNVSVEIKHRSAVTDQFKCRAYDVMHLKQTYGDDFLGVLVYVKTTAGISVDRARRICYPFDHFFAVAAQSKHNPTAWNDLISAIEAFVSK